MTMYKKLKDQEKSYLKESKEMLMQILRVKVNDLKGLYAQNI